MRPSSFVLSEAQGKQEPSRLQRSADAPIALVRHTRRATWEGGT